MHDSLREVTSQPQFFIAFQNYQLCQKIWEYEMMDSLILFLVSFLSGHLTRRNSICGKNTGMPVFRKLDFLHFYLYMRGCACIIPQLCQDLSIKISSSPVLIHITQNCIHATRCFQLNPLNGWIHEWMNSWNNEVWMN